MASTNRSRHLQRPSGITLILSASEQTDTVLQLLQLLEVNSDDTVILAQHRSDEQNTEFVNQVSKLSSLNPRPVHGNVTLNRGRLYLIEPHLGYEINSVDQIKPLSERSSGDHNLLESLAQHFPSKTRVIVLSAMYFDQLQGLSTSSSAFPDLFTLDVIREMAPMKFSEIAAKHKVHLGTNLDELCQLLRAPIKRGLRPIYSVSNRERTGYEQIIRLLKRDKNSDFSQYKEASLINRIEKRMHRLRLSNLQQYADRLRVDNAELDNLYSALFIGMTRFFRDTPSFVELQAQLSNYIVRSGNRRLRIWSAGCSTGAEPYSLALICDLMRHGMFPELKVEICATDTDAQAIAVARAGCYSREEIERIPTEYLPANIELKAGKYDLKGAVKTEVQFEQHDLLTPPTGSDLDLIVCRNVFIYFKPQTHKRILSNFYHCLKPGGLLMLGRNETIGLEQTQFRALSDSAKIYKALQLSPSS